MIREIIVDIREGDDSVRKRILDAITRELNCLAMETEGIDPEFFGGVQETQWRIEALVETGDMKGLPKFPGKVIINVFDENEELMEIIET